MHLLQSTAFQEIYKRHLSTKDIYKPSAFQILQVNVEPWPQEEGALTKHDKIAIKLTVLQDDIAQNT